MENNTSKINKKGKYHQYTNSCHKSIHVLQKKNEQGI